MVSIGVTGGIACGKSTVGDFMARAGVPVCEADEVAHVVLRENAEVRATVVREFGKEILDGNGDIDRRLLGQRVFGDPASRLLLNSIVHPAVKLAWEKWMAETAGRSRSAAVIIPLLYEVHEEKNWDAVLCVACSREDQVRRMRERGLSDSDIDARLAAQMALSEKMERADYVIFNGGSLEVLREQTMKVIALVMEKHDA